MGKPSGFHCIDESPECYDWPGRWKPPRRLCLGCGVRTLLEKERALEWPTRVARYFATEDPPETIDSWNHRMFPRTEIGDSYDSRRRRNIWARELCWSSSASSDSSDSERPSKRRKGLTSEERKLERSKRYKEEDEREDLNYAREHTLEARMTSDDVPKSGWQIVLRRWQIGKCFDGFLLLPREIRNRIYEFSLVRGKIFVPNANTYRHPEIFGGRERCDHAINIQGDHRLRYITDPEMDHERSAPLATGLLCGVNKQIQQEATQVFWGSGNQLIFPAGNWTEPFAFNYDQGTINGVPDDIPPAKDVSYAFDMRDYPSELNEYEQRGEAFDSIRDESDEDWPTITPLQMRERIHAMRKDNLFWQWESRCSIIRYHLALTRLQIDFEECYCPTGCCRMVDDVCQQLSGEWTKRAPLRIEIIGWEDDDEKQLISDRFVALGETAITFVGKSIREAFESSESSE